jgi:anti-anti-sigma factor
MLQLDLDQQGDVCVARFQGRLSAGSELEYLGTRGDEIKRLACTKLLADFSRVQSVGSTGIGFIVSLYTSVTTKPGGRFVLAGANARVREVLDLTRLSAILPMAPDVEAGMALLQSREAGAVGR